MACMWKDSTKPVTILSTLSDPPQGSRRMGCSLFHSHRTIYNEFMTNVDKGNQILLNKVLILVYL